MEASDQGFDNVIVFGIKDDDVFLGYTPFESRTNLIGALESIKLWLWTKQAVVDELNELVEFDE